MQAMANAGMTLRQMEVFHAVMQTGSATGAAKVLNTTQPAVSSILGNCESRLGMKLFDRVSGRLHPTPEATALMPDVEAVFSRLDAVNRRTRDLAQGLRGTLSLAAAFPIANGYLSKAVAQFIAGRSDASVTLQSLTSAQVLDRVVNREAELGFAYETIAGSPAVEAERLVGASISCVARVDHPLARQKEINIRDLADQPIITYLPQILSRTLVDHAFIEADIVPRIVGQVSISLTGIMLASYGMGVALVEPLMVSAMEMPNVVFRPLKPHIAMNILLIRNRNTPLSKLASAFAEELRRTIPDDLATRA